MAEARLHAIISGRVQGVGFRYFVHREAAALGLAGFVRNLHHRRVEVVAEGERATLEQLRRSLEEGPSAAGVEHVEVTWGEPTGAFRDFTVQHSG